MSATLTRNTAIYFCFTFLVGFYLATGTTILFERELGLSFTQIFMLDALYMLMFLLFEIPSGALADLLGRKKTIVVGLLVLALAALATGSAETFWHLFFSFFIWAFGFSLISGASEAILYDAVNDEKLYHRIYGTSVSFSILGMAAAGVVGPLLFSVHFRLPYLLSALPFTLAAVAMLFFIERHRYASNSFSVRKHLAHMRHGIRVAFQNKHILWSMALLSLVFAVSYTFTSSYQPYLIEVGFAVTSFAFILPIMFLFEAFGGKTSQRITLFFGEKSSFWVLLLTLGTSLVLLAFFASKFVVPLLFVYGFVQGVLKPLISTYANRYIDSKERATVISVQSMVGTVIASALLFSFGFLTDKVGVIALAGIIGALVLTFGTWLLFLKPRQ